MNFTKDKMRVGAGALLSAALVILTHCANFLEAAASAPTAIVATPAEYPAGSAGRFLQLGAVKDRRARVTINGGASATVNGVTISSLAVNGAGAIRALVSTSCKARDARFTLQAADGGGWVAYAPLKVAVTPNPPPTLSYNSLHTAAPGGKLTIKPARGLSDQGDIAEVAVHRVTPKFDGKLSVDEQGVVTVSNAPAGGSYNITIRATDNCGADAYAGFRLKVSGGNGECPIIGVNPSNLRDGAVGAHYFQRITAEGAALPHKFSLASGALPPGLRLFPLGIIAGAPTRAGDYEFSLRVTDKHGCAGAGVYTLRIKGAGSGGAGDGVHCTYTIASSNQDFSRAGGSGEIRVATEPACVWRAESEADWIQIASRSLVRGSDAMPFTVARNLDKYPREGHIRIANRVVTIKQAPTAVPVRRVRGETEINETEAGDAEKSAAKPGKAPKDETESGEVKKEKVKKDQPESGEVKKEKTKKDQPESGEVKKERRSNIEKE